jgi:hypothetical protein
MASTRQTAEDTKALDEAVRMVREKWKKETKEMINKISEALLFSYLKKKKKIAESLA